MAITARARSAEAQRQGLLTQSLLRLGEPRVHAQRVAAKAMRHFFQPSSFSAALSNYLDGRISRLIVNGTLDRRVVLFDRGNGAWLLASLAGVPLRSLEWPATVDADLTIDEPNSAISAATLSDDLIWRLTRPQFLLVALYHPEHLPLPRFALSISDLARAVRSKMIGQIELMDMQLGSTIADIVARYEACPPDVFGVSATFGQHDILISLTDALARLEAIRPLLVFGGSLCALNRGLLLERFPDAIVCSGQGEVTIQDIAGFWHGDLPLERIRNADWRDPHPLTTLHTPGEGDSPHIAPELDLLEATLLCKGAMQLESSRGCTHACSFCPRSHKGHWTGYPVDHFRTVLDEASAIHDCIPITVKRLFLVDEEFVGCDATGQRARSICDLVSSLAFEWEASTRLDQVYRPEETREWNLQRMALWKYFREHGLSRCLFGVESGVNSVLERFNKRITAEQIVVGIRILTALAVPIRCTYITFDHLMTLEELMESYRFQGRDDLLLEPQPGLGLEELLDAVHDDQFAARHNAGRPFYSSVSYMLTSMEPLMGAPYSLRLEAAGLVRGLDPGLGRRLARFADARIGVMSDWSQRWIDRNFSFDYTLKSLEKVGSGEERRVIRATRGVIRQSAWAFFGDMLSLASATDLAPTGTEGIGRAATPTPSGITPSAAQRMADFRFAELVSKIASEMPILERAMDSERWAVLREEHVRWVRRSGWELING